MIVSRIIGGLGNQMFQYAVGRALALQRDDVLRLDITDFADYRLHHGFELARVFACTAQLATLDNLEAILGWQAHHRIRKLLMCPGFAYLRRKEWVIEPFFHYWPDIHNVPQDCVLVGYWQSQRYFAAHAATIREEFAFKQPLTGLNAELAEKIQVLNAVSLHVRRGDFVRDPRTARVHGVDLSDYYPRAIDMIRQRVTNPHFFVFSDEPEWVRGHLDIPGTVTYVEHNRGADSYRDMQLMSLCKHHIIANSTFSWWGAWLNPSKEKIVIAPKRWFNDPSIDCGDLYPDDWIIL